MTREQDACCEAIKTLRLAMEARDKAWKNWNPDGTEPSFGTEQFDAWTTSVLNYRVAEQALKIASQDL